MIWLSAFVGAAIAAGVGLPGVPVPFLVDGGGRWTLPAELPSQLATAGLEPGWVLTAVDDAPFDATNTPREVAAGPSRQLRLQFVDPTPAAGGDASASTLVVIRRSELVGVVEVKRIPWPAGLTAPVKSWKEAGAGPVAIDSAGAAWQFVSASATFVRVDVPTSEQLAIPDLLWSLTEAQWAISRPAGVSSGDASWARRALGDGVRVRGVSGQAGDALLHAEVEGLAVLQVGWPYGTPSLPTCASDVPETCLASGRQILAELSDRTGARDEARRQLTLACSLGVYRACYEVGALDVPAQAQRASSCVSGDLLACQEVSQHRLSMESTSTAKPGPVAIGMLEFACGLEGSGSLGERLRRLDNLGSACMSLSEAYDRLERPEAALLVLDQACVLGRSDACEQATARRESAFAAKTVRECEDAALPNAASCVELGRLLQVGPVTSANLDDFGAFLRGCFFGASDGCLSLGDYVDRWGVEHPRVMEAEQLLLSACKTGEALACLGAGDLLVRHEPRTDGYASALRLFDQGCDSGLGAACVDGARQRRIGRARAVEAPTQGEMWRSACALHSGPGCAGLGVELVDHRAGWPDAFVAWTKACELGSAASCTELGALVLRKHDPIWEGELTSDLYLQRGCDRGDAEGCFGLAEQTWPDADVPDESTYLLLDRSCEGGSGAGCNRLAEVHMDRDTSFDDEIAARHYSSACDTGFFESCKDLGLMYLRGEGVDRDRAHANELLDRYRLNAALRYVRLGAIVGLPMAVGGELELIAPIPVGPAIGLSGHASYVPQGAGLLIAIQGDDVRGTAPDLIVKGATVRVYPNHQARGIFVAGGVDSIADDVEKGRERDRTGWSFRFGMRNDSGALFAGVEMGLGYYGTVELVDFDEEESGSIPLVVPAFALTFGLAPF